MKFLSTGQIQIFLFFIFSIFTFVLSTNKCGVNFASSACGTLCPRGVNSECPAGQTCFASAPNCITPSPTSTTSSPIASNNFTDSPTPQKNPNRCGLKHAFAGCGTLCPRGVDSECNQKIGERCFADPPDCQDGIGTACQVPSNPDGGACLHQTDCNSTTSSTYSGFCPGPSDVKCCVKFEGTLCESGGTSGQCKQVSDCTTTTVSGLCPGPSSIKCCLDEVATDSPTIFLDPDSTDCTVGITPGVCKDTSECLGVAVAGLCYGPSNIKCCVLEPLPGSPKFIPNAPDTSDSLGTCVTPQNAFHGDCIDVAECTGATFNGLCPGSSAIKCCSAETQPVLDVSSVSPVVLNLSLFHTVFNGISQTRAAAMLRYFNYGFSKVVLSATDESKACYRTAAFIAQIGHESGGLKFFEEIASGAAYENRTDLGNVFPGDGVRYKGRGPIQLTGRANYRSSGGRIGVDIEAVPELVCFPNVGFLTTVDFWMSRNLNQYSDTDSDAQFELLTRRINGGVNGLADRIQRWNVARDLLGCDSNSSNVAFVPKPLKPSGFLNELKLSKPLAVEIAIVDLADVADLKVLIYGKTTENKTAVKGTLTKEELVLGETYNLRNDSKPGNDVGDSITLLSATFPLNSDLIDEDSAVAIIVNGLIAEFWSPKKETFVDYDADELYTQEDISWLFYGMTSRIIDETPDSGLASFSLVQSDFLSYQRKGNGTNAKDFPTFGLSLSTIGKVNAEQSFVGYNLQQEEDHGFGGILLHAIAAMIILLGVAFCLSALLSRKRRKVDSRVQHDDVVEEVSFLTGTSPGKTAADPVPKVNTNNPMYI